MGIEYAEGEGPEEEREEGKEDREERKEESPLGDQPFRGPTRLGWGRHIPFRPPRSVFFFLRTPPRTR
jgi:hypothetical protein